MLKMFIKKILERFFCILNQVHAKSNSHLVTPWYLTHH